LLVAPLVFAGADTFYPLPDDEKPFSVQRMFQLQTVVNGATCEDKLPQQSGFPSTSITVSCPRTDGWSLNKGCSLDQWYGYYESYIAQIHMDPGEERTIRAGRTYELYYCSDTEVQCGAESDGGCGGNAHGVDCPETMMLRTRTCDPPGGSWEATCVERSECLTTCNSHWVCGSWSECDANNKQSRKCYDANVCGDSSSRPTEYKSCESQLQDGDGSGGEDGDGEDGEKDEFPLKIWQMVVIGA